MAAQIDLDINKLLAELEVLRAKNIEPVSSPRPEDDQPETLTWQSIHTLLDEAGLPAAGSPTVFERFQGIQATLAQKMAEITNANIQIQHLNAALARAEKTLEEFKVLFANGHRHNSQLKTATAKEIAQNEPLHREIADLRKQKDERDTSIECLTSQLKFFINEARELDSELDQIRQNPLAFWGRKWFNRLLGRKS